MPDRYIVFWLREDAPQDDKLALREDLYRRLGDDTVPSTAGENKIDWSKQPRWRKKAAPATIGRILAVPVANLQRMGVDLANVTDAKFDIVKATFASPDYLEVHRGDDPKVVLDEAGFEPETEK